MRVLEMGAGGDTQNEILSFLGLRDFGKLDKETQWHTETKWHKSGKDILAQLNTQHTQQRMYDIYTALGVFVDSKFELIDEFKQINADFYDAKVANLDFKNQQEKAVSEMNQFVSLKTNGIIQNIVDNNEIDTNTQMFIINSLYFKGSWDMPFDKSDTETRKFYVATSENNQLKYVGYETPFMFTTSMFDLYRDMRLGIEILTLPYANKHFNFLIIRNVKHPNYANGERYGTEKSLSEIINYFSDDINNKILRLLQNLSEDKVSVGLPKFTHEASFEMSELLKNMGVRQMFQNNANFTRMTKNDNSKVSTIKHKAKVEVNEVGTTAAAVTSGKVVAKSLPIQFICDYEFMYVIFHTLTKKALFTGVYTKPTSTDLVHGDTPIIHQMTK